MYKKKLHIPKIFSNLECSIFKLYNLVMCNLYTKFVKYSYDLSKASVHDINYLNDIKETCVLLPESWAKSVR